MQIREKTITTMNCFIDNLVGQWFVYGDPLYVRKIECNCYGYQCTTTEQQLKWMEKKSKWNQQIMIMLQDTTVLQGNLKWYATLYHVLQCIVLHPEIGLRNSGGFSTKNQGLEVLNLLSILEVAEYLLSEHAFCKRKAYM